MTENENKVNSFLYNVNKKLMLCNKDFFVKRGVFEWLKKL